MLEVLLGLLLIIIIGFTSIIYYSWITISIPANSPIYYIILKWRRYSKQSYTVNTDGKLMLVQVNGGKIAFPFDSRWVGVKITLIKHNGDHVELLLPSGAVFKYSANDLGVHTIIVYDNNTGNRIKYTGNDDVKLVDTIEEL